MFAGNFLGFLVHQRGIEVDKNKTKAILEAKACKQELQSLLGHLNYIAGKVQVFSELLKLKQEEEFKWEAIKRYITQPPALMPPIKKKPLRLYNSVAEGSIGSLLAQNNEQGKEQAVYYLSRLLTLVALYFWQPM